MPGRDDERNDCVGVRVHAARIVAAPGHDRRLQRRGAAHKIGLGAYSLCPSAPPRAASVLATRKALAKPFPKLLPVLLGQLRCRTRVQSLDELPLQLLARTRELIDGCPCETGCPSCVGPEGATGPLAKSVASRLLEALVARRAAA